MSLLSRYILRHLAAAFGFFLLVFTGVVWLTQAVRLIDTVIAGGEGPRVFLQFSLLVLPQVMVIVLPLSAIGAALYALNRLYTDTELIVMMAAGVGPGRLLRPVLVFGAAIAALMLVVTTLLVPLSGRELAERRQQIGSDMASALIVPRQFIHPMTGVTLFIDDASRAGEMGGLFLNDQRDPAQVVTYSAERAQLLREGDAARLVMLDGIALTARDRSLNTVRFDRFVFDLSELLRADDVRTPRPSEYGVAALLFPSAAMLAGDRYDRGDFISEGHYKLALPLLALLYPVIALVTLLAGGYRRGGFGRRVVVAVAVAVMVHVLQLVMRGRVQDDAGLWPAMYLPHLLGMIYCAALFWWIERGRRPRGGLPGGGSPAGEGAA